MIAVVTQVRQRIKERFRPRALEWEHTAMTVAWGFIVIRNPANFDAPAYQAALFSVPGPLIWGWGVFVLGILRLLALGINGYMARPTALARSAGAVVGIVLYAVISLGLLFSGTGPTGLGLYPVIAVFGLFSLFWAVIDVMVQDQHDT